MSSIYVSEPPTKGKVIIQTSYGPLDIELWPKEAPLAVRNFVQLCLDEYYYNTIFHRIIKSYLVQGGDPTGTGTGGESIYGRVFADEFHSRLRFNHRGIVACANAGSPHSNGSQFFISLDRCDWNDRKNTIFGKVTGDSIYNLLRLGEVETDKNDRPVDAPPKIISIEVLWNPFDDIVPRLVLDDTLPLSINNAEVKGLEKKSVKKLNLLSFGEEAEEEENEFTAAKQKIRSSHDVLDDPRLLKGDPLDKTLSPSETQRTLDLQLSVRESLSLKNQQSQNKLEDKALDSRHYRQDDDGGGETNFDARMREQIIKKREELGDQPTKRKLPNESSRSKKHEIATPRPKTESFDNGKKVGKLSLKIKGVGSEALSERMSNANVDLKLLNESERARQLNKQNKRRLQGRQDEVLAKLQSSKKVFASNHNKSDGDESNDKLSDWKSNSLKFKPETSNDGMSRKEDPNDYVVTDPLLEKGKEKFNKMHAKQKRRKREWAGESLT